MWLHVAAERKKGTRVDGYVNQEGQTITPDQMAQIEQRHEGKQALLAEMRRDRETQYGQRHSHVGVEIARDLADLTLISHTYHNLAAMANYCAVAGREGAGRVLASLANGVMRGAVDVFGKDIEPRILDFERLALEQARQDLGLTPKRTDELEPIGLTDTRTQAQIEADGDTHWPDGRPYERWVALKEARAAYERGEGNNPDYFIIDDAPGSEPDESELSEAEQAILRDYPDSDAAKAIKLTLANDPISNATITDEEGNIIARARTLEGVVSQSFGDRYIPDAGHNSTQESQDAIAAIIRGDYVAPAPQDDTSDGPEPGMAMREAVSPEPIESPQRKAARLRREARKLAQAQQTGDSVALSGNAAIDYPKSE